MFGSDKTSEEEKKENQDEGKESGPEATSKDTADQKKPEFGGADFDFPEELKRLPFTINIGQAPLTQEQQVRFINLIYEYKEVFSLFDGDLG